MQHLPNTGDEFCVFHTEFLDFNSLDLIILGFDADDECLLINTSIPGYHISLAYLPALNYSCDMDIRPISIYFMAHNSQN